jgi:hypothetical protein
MQASSCAIDASAKAVREAFMCSSKVLLQCQLPGSLTAVPEGMATHQGDRRLSVSSCHLLCRRRPLAAPVDRSLTGTSGCSCHQAARVRCRTQGWHLASLVHVNTLLCTRTVSCTHHKTQRHHLTHTPEACRINKSHHAADTQKYSPSDCYTTQHYWCQANS